MNTIKEICDTLQEMAIILASFLAIAMIAGMGITYLFPHMALLRGNASYEVFSFAVGSFWIIVGMITYIGCKIFITDIYGIYFVIRELIKSYKEE